MIFRLLLFLLIAAAQMYAVPNYAPPDVREETDVTQEDAFDPLTPEDVSGDTLLLTAFSMYRSKEGETTEDVVYTDSYSVYMNGQVMRYSIHTTTGISDLEYLNMSSADLRRMQELTKDDLAGYNEVDFRDGENTDLWFISLYNGAEESVCEFGGEIEGKKELEEIVSILLKY